MRYYISDLHFGHAKLNTEMDPIDSLRLCRY